VRIHSLHIEHFRSLDKLDLELGAFAVLCGPNSSGKSNVLKAIEFCWKPRSQITPVLVYENLDYAKRDNRGNAPSIKVHIQFKDCPAEVCGQFGLPGDLLDYDFTATKNTASVTRKVGGVAITEEQFERDLRQHFDMVYIPPIRDIGGDGLQPFRQLVARALERGRGEQSFRRVTERARKLVEDRAKLLLRNTGSILARVSGADRLDADTRMVNLDDLLGNLALSVTFGGKSIGLEGLGTGHQSEVVLHLYTELGESMPGETVYLFEEPDNHLHPSSIRSVGDDLRKLSASSQVITTTHSPVLLNHVGFESIVAIGTNDKRHTVRRYFQPSLTNPQIRALMARIGMRATEPLLAKKTIVVEGPSDAVVLSHLHLLREGRSPDQCDLLLIPAGGKDELVKYCSLLQSLDVDWCAVLDNDACLSGEPPVVDISQLPDPVLVAQSLGVLGAALDANSKRGRKARGLVQALQEEVSGRPPATCVWQGSPLQRLVEIAGVLGPSEQQTLASRLSLGQIQEPRKILRKSKVFLHGVDLEHSLVAKDAALDAVETALARIGQNAIAASTTKERRAKIVARIHNLSGDADALRIIVDELETANALGKTDVNACYNFLFR
jgi:energy-coupling factor transporter ATP-binding protein EcfA2